ncbi:recombinase family protein [Corynebacterium sp. CCM 9204]|uniref:recombinase family protein n=1 Tax=Corynebacterium sp. CCM 9204 TaxID=3057616 RepID=UPI0035263FD1
MSVYGYARVSTRTQKTDRQTDELTAAGVEHIYTDHYTGRTMQRPNFQACLEVLSEGDTLVVCDLDRLGRTTVEIIHTAEELQQRGVRLKILRLGVDTSTSEGKFFYRLAASLAELEADRLRQHTMQGLEAARKRGRIGGRPKALTPAQADRARELHAAGESQRRLAELFGVSRTAIITALNQQ